MGFKIVTTCIIFMAVAMNLLVPFVTWQYYSGTIPQFMLNPYMIVLTWLMFVVFAVYGYTFTYPRGTLALRNVGRKGKMFIRVWYYVTLVAVAYTMWECLQCTDHKNNPDFEYAMDYW